jgi:Polysaccharide lyase family 4, domain II
MRHGDDHGTAGSRVTRTSRASIRRVLVAVLGVVAALLVPIALQTATVPAAHAAASCPPVGCAVTIDARDFATGAPLTDFNYIINVDNTKLPGDPNSLSTESNSPIVREGDASRKTVTLPEGRYLVSVRATDHKMWGAYLNLPADAAADGSDTVRIDLTTQSDEHPLPTGKIRVFVFNDNAWTNGAPDTEEAGLGGFQIGLEEQTGNAVTVDYNNNPLCGGICTTSSQPATVGFAEINNLGPATYFIDVHPPDGPCNSNPDSQWYQTTTIDGGLNLMAPTEEGADGTGAPGEQLWEPPNIRTAYWFGFVCSPRPFTNPGTGEITGTARNWVEWAPYKTGTFTDPVENPFLALSDASTDQTVFVGQGDAAGNFDIQNVPAGDYNLAVWDEQLSYIMRFKPVTVAPGQTVDMNDVGDDGSVGLGVSRWFGWLDGKVYKDTNGNGQYDPGVDPPIGNTDMDQRWRDGSIKESTFTNPSGDYEYPTAEGGALGRWFVNEQGFARFSADPGASTHDERTGDVTPSCLVDGTPVDPCIPNSQGGGLLMNQSILEGHRSTVDWGKRDYPAGTPGQIVGITYFATTRNEFDARFQAHEDYEPAIPDVTVFLETPGPDGSPNTDDDVVVNKYVTDHWQQPNANQDPVDPENPGFSQSCNPILDEAGTDVTDQFNPDIGPNCLEVPLAGAHTKEGAFDGGYAFANYCPDGYDLDTDACQDGTAPDDHPLVAGNYIVHAIMPKDDTDTDRLCNPAGESQRVTEPHGTVPGGGSGCLYHIVREEDVNVDLGNHFAPQIPPPPCNGDDHVIDKSTLTPRSTFFPVAGAHAPLCDKHLVVLQNQQNANADFFMMTNFRTDPNGEDASDTRVGDVPEPGRVVGQVFNDIYFERNQLSNWYGEPRPIANIPIGIYARVDTVCQGGGTSCATPNVNLPFDRDNWRLIKTVNTSADGAYEALLPSTETLNCPIPQGPCPGMYIAIVDDPGTKAHPNPNYDPNLLTANTPFEVWPGLTDQLDTPVDPISGTGCQDPAGAAGGVAPDPSDPARPELLQVSRPYVNAGDAGTARRITIQADFIGPQGTQTGATGVRATLTDARNGEVETLTRGNGGIVSWTPGSGSTADTIVIQVPALASNAVANLLPNASFRPGPKQLTITTANSNPGGGGVSSVNGLTVHVMGTNGTLANTVSYNPPVVNVAAPPPTGTNPNALQNAIDGAAPGSLLVLSPGTYNENVLVWKPLKIQGLGPGGIIGAHEFQGRDPEDPRFNVKGTVIDGRFFQQNFSGYDATVAAHAPYVLPNFTSGSPSVVLRGADITVVAKTTSAYDVTALPAGQDSAGFGGARIDGLGLMTGHGDGAGGVQLQASINNMQLTNNVLENNGGVFAGGIGVGQPFVHGSHNYNVRIANDRLIGNGGLTSSGGAGIFYGSNNYEVANSVLCSNFGVEYGGGLSHIGLSPGGSIHDNKIYYNEAVDSGGGIAIESELPVGGGLGDGSGSVNVDRNLIQSNASTLDDAGGIFVLDALTAPINIRNNMIVDNLAADLGGAILLDDSANTRIINNTIANNVTTGSSENSAVGQPHGAGLTSEANDPLFQAMLPAGSPDFSNPVALFNNVFWNNDAMTLDQFSPGATLVDNGFIDFEIHGTTNNADTFTPRYSTLTNGNILGPDGVQHPVPGGQGNRIGEDPAFVAPFILELAVSGSRLDPQQAAVTITGADPPVGLTGDYHLLALSPAVDRGVRCAATPFPAPTNALSACTTTNRGVGAPAGLPSSTNLTGGGDYDSQYRPQLRTLRLLTPWDLGADELPGVPVVLTGPLQ